MGNEKNGLKKLRKVTGPEPTHNCNNCKCARYSPCTCTKKGEKKE